MENLIREAAEVFRANTPKTKKQIIPFKPYKHNCRLCTIAIDETGNKNCQPIPHAEYESWQVKETVSLVKQILSTIETSYKKKELYYEAVRILRYIPITKGIPDNSKVSGDVLISNSNFKLQTIGYKFAGDEDADKSPMLGTLVEQLIYDIKNTEPEGRNSEQIVLTENEIKVLKTLNKYPHPLPQEDIAITVGNSRKTIGEYLENTRKFGLTKKTGKGEYITDKGKKYLE
jgi:predicted DNA-binding protein (UPF0251 family)